MAENKKSFLLYCDIIHTVKKLTDDQSGRLFKHILSYVNDENPDMEDPILDLVFEPIKQSLKRDLKRYESICNRNQINGSKGGRPTKTVEINPKNPVGNLGTQINPKNPVVPKKADIDSDIDIDIDSGIDKEENKNKIIFCKAVEWMKQNTPSILKMKEPLTEKQFTELHKKFSNDQIKHLLLKMHNWEPLTKKNKSANLTFQDWAKRETFKEMIIEHKTETRKPMTEFQKGMTGMEYLTYGLKPEYR